MKRNKSLNKRVNKWFRDFNDEDYCSGELANRASVLIKQLREESRSFETMYKEQKKISW